MSAARARLVAPVLIVLVFVVSRLLFAPIGLGVSTVSFDGDLVARAGAALRGELFDTKTIEQGMPILDVALLRNDLWRSLWYLHSQPPLFNAFVAGMLRLPGDFARNYQYANWAMGLALYLLTYALMLRLGIGRAIAAGATILFLLNPNAMWLENAVYYGLPLALLLILAVHAYDRALRRTSAGWLATAALLVVTMVLTRAFFTAIWCAIVLAFFAATFAKKNGARVKAAIAVIIPFALIVAFQAKQYALFGQALGSSWFGCNLTTMTAGMRPEKAKALAAGKVSPLVDVYRNDTVESYSRFVRVQPTGIPALDAPRKSTGQPNFNHLIYIPIGQHYLHDSRYVILRAPHKYAVNVVNSVYIFSGYQIGIYFDRPSVVLSRFTWPELLAPLVGFPLIVLAIVHAWRRIRRGDGDRALLALLLFNVLYVAAVSCLLEKSEGPVYRQQIDAFLWTFLASAAMSWLPAIRALFARAPRMPELSDVRH